MLKNILKIFFVVILLVNAIKTETLSILTVNGQRVSIKDYPFVVRLQIWPNSGGYTYGTGSLISSKCVLTARHAVKDNRLTICGGSDTDGEGVCIEALRYIYMENDDIAVVVLKKPMQGNNIRPVQMNFNKIQADTWVKYVGWGRTLSGNDNPKKYHLNMVNFQVQPDNKCGRPSIICYWDRSNRQNTEPGDSGGPVIYNNKLIAVHDGKIHPNGVTTNFGARLSHESIKSFVLNEFKKSC